MTSILVVGNSHAGALKRGWDTLESQDRRGADLAFFVSPSPIFSRLGFKGTLFGAVEGIDLAPKQLDFLIEMNGKTTIDLAGYDHILLAGMGWPGTDEILSFLTRFAVDGLYEHALPQRLTQRGFDTLLRGAFARVVPDPNWAGTSLPPVTVLLRPMPSERIRVLTSQQIANRGYWAQARIAYDKMRPLLDRQTELAAAYYAEMGLTLLPQPEETRTPSGLTRAQFEKASSGTSSNGYIDVGHMNRDFGRICMTSFLDHVAAAAGPN